MPTGTVDTTAPRHRFPQYPRVDREGKACGAALEAVEPNDLASRKHLLSPRILLLEGVSGVGLGQDEVVVCLLEEYEGVRPQGRAVVEAEAPGKPIAFEVRVAFRRA